MSKTRIGVYLLISAAVGIVTTLAFDDSNSDNNTAMQNIGVLVFLGGIFAGIPLIIIGKRETGMDMKDVLHYAERNSWHPITKTSWRSIKGNNVSLSAVKSQVSKTFILKIEADGIDRSGSGNLNRGISGIAA